MPDGSWHRLSGGSGDVRVRPSPSPPPPLSRFAPSPQRLDSLRTTPRRVADSEPPAWLSPRKVTVIHAASSANEPTSIQRGRRRRCRAVVRERCFHVRGSGSARGIVFTPQTGAPDP